jgi:hypothetical protein
VHLLLACALLLAAPGLAGPKAAASVGPAPSAAAPDDRAWAVATSRMLGAAGTVRDRAWRLRQSAEGVSQAGRVGGVSALVADVRELDRAVVSAVLAAEVLAQAAPAPAAP